MISDSRGTSNSGRFITAFSLQTVFIGSVDSRLILPRTILVRLSIPIREFRLGRQAAGGAGIGDAPCCCVGQEGKGFMAYGQS